MTLFSRRGSTCFLSALPLMMTALSLSSPIMSPEIHHRLSVSRDVHVNPLLEKADLDAQDFLSHFLSTLNLTEPRPQPGRLVSRKEPPDYMLELYNRFTADRSAVPSANIVRSFKNEDSSPHSVTGRGVRIHPLLFNISIPHHEHITVAELRLFTLVQKAERPNAGLHCKVTIYKIQEGALWTEEMEKGGRVRAAEEEEEEEEGEMKDLEQVVTKRIYATNNGWVSFDLTRVVTQWRKSGCPTLRLDVHISNVGSGQEANTRQVTAKHQRLDGVGIDRGSEGKHNAVLIVFSDGHSKDKRKQDKQELSQMIERESDLPQNEVQSQQTMWGHHNHNTGRINHAELDAQSLTQLQSNLIYDTPPRIRRNVKSEPCRRTPLFVDFKDIGWDTWVIQPLGYEAYECNGVCNPPMTSEVSPTKHAIVQTLLSVKNPERASRACCVPTKLEPISLLYHENEVITFNHKYEGMVVAECGCR